VARAYYGGAGKETIRFERLVRHRRRRPYRPLGYMQITDRAKDVIKSGGEWISTIDIENMAVGHPDVAEAAVIGVQHPKWDERPLLVIVSANLARIQPRIASAPSERQDREMVDAGRCGLR
jgi:fatty-acyl-CoA synthase